MRSATGSQVRCVNDGLQDYSRPNKKRRNDRTVAVDIVLQKCMLLTSLLQQQSQRHWAVLMIIC